MSFEIFEYGESSSAVKPAADYRLCTYCAKFHSGTCPRVKSMEFYDNGVLKKIEFHEPKSSP